MRTPDEPVTSRIHLPETRNFENFPIRDHGVIARPGTGGPTTGARRCGPGRTARGEPPSFPVNTLAHKGFRRTVAVRTTPLAVPVPGGRDRRSTISTALPLPSRATSAN